MRKLKVLVACEYSGRVRDAFNALGHKATSCDLLPTDVRGRHYQGDVRDILNDGWDLMVAHPNCKRLANSGSRWLYEDCKTSTAKQNWIDMEEAAKFYLDLRNAPITRKAIENPIMHCHAAQLIGNPLRSIVQPWWFGDPFFKATGFELHELPPLVPTNKLTPPLKGSEEYKQWSAIHYASPGPNRWKFRSTTFLGVAAAMAEQWGQACQPKK